MPNRPETRLPLVVGELTLRRVTAGDARDLLEYRSDPEVARYQYNEPATAERIADIIDLQTRFEAGDPGPPLLLAVVQGGKVIGDCQLVITSPEHGQGEVGFTFHPKFTGRGLATRAVTATLGFGFCQLRIHRIVGATDVRNERAWQLMERVGMRREGHLLHDAFAKGRWVDVFTYAMLADEWHQRYPELVPVVSAG
jgi:RimJ/RimL family protein N-acetyltransferase